MIIGVDAGKKGAAALLSSSNELVEVFDLPLADDGTLDAKDFLLRLSKWNPSWLVVEDCFRPKSLVRMVGEIVAAAKILDMEYRVTAVVTWKKKILGENTSDKNKSIKKCLQLYPNAPLLKTPKCTVPSADRAEAVLLAYYGSILL